MIDLPTIRQMIDREKHYQRQQAQIDFVMDVFQRKRDKCYSSLGEAFEDLLSDCDEDTWPMMHEALSDAGFYEDDE